MKSRPLRATGFPVSMPISVRRGPRATLASRTPIGKTAKGELLYSMKRDNMPAPPPPPQAEAREAAPAAAPEPEVKRGGIFGWSYDRRE